ncbi:gliding motility-associated ABC transporter ATP-binding subunit GldA [Parafilimonas terrae]|uniref:Protein involved in gliding motility GldA n=1 Tax=Parafilimonas terrae TaxID=1465490 RepID=A0A1I5X991_9BACT|nr:gliding motility-associated ABC transporter ATP-binding subunit GldA [Parafilimonas terrae]SFQ28406.1 protein involved in gliding motility GldA [Parafilimonas terrae]
MSIEVKNLLKQYGEQKAVNNVSFSVGKGEIVGFLGPNGAGKSTTMKMITGYLQPDDGNIKVCGADVSKDVMNAKKKIGYLPESNPLYYDMYVKEYLQFIAGVHEIQHAKEKIQNVIELTGLSIESKKRTGQLSKGYKQRVGLAAALLHDPEVLILDEPTSGLDPNQIIEIRNVIKEQGRNKTVLFSSHILQEVQAICDRVIIINKGQLVADSSVEALKQNVQSNSIAVSFSTKINKAQLESLPGAKQVVAVNDQSFKISTSDTNELRRQLLEFAVAEQLDITSLQTEGNNLEDIFRSLTTSNVNPRLTGSVGQGQA